MPAAQPITPSSSSPMHEAGPLRELKLWLRSLIHRPNFFTAQPLHPLRDLQKALYLAVTELTRNLEPRLENIINTAIDLEHNIQLKADDFDQDRMLNVDELQEAGVPGISRMSRQAVVKCLVLARDEIEWVDNETKRLEVHAQNAEEQRKTRYRRSFEYQPTPRKVRGPLDWAIGEEEGEDDAADVKNEEVVEDSDEDMLGQHDEVEEGEIVEKRRDSIDDGSWGALQLGLPKT